MKKQSFITLFFLLAGFLLWGQGVPPGINYQAVARDSKGVPMIQQSIQLKIALLAGGANGKSVYEESHAVTTGQLGAFNIVIGQGQTLNGDFLKVPWSEYEIWMELSVDEDNRGVYEPLSASRLMAVPYAFHAGTADQVKGGEGVEKTAAFWKVNGNDLTVPGPHFIGTLDSRDFVMKTTNLERLRITAAGDVNIANSLNVGVDVNAGRDINAGRDLTAGRNLDVDNNAHIGNDLDVDRNANIDGDLTVHGIARFLNTAQSTNKDNGSVIVEGGVGIEKNINVGGNSAVTGTSDVDGIARFNNTAQSTNKDNGSVIVEGGVGIEKNINVGGNSAVTGTSDVDGIARFNNTTQSTTKDNGAVIVEGGVGIEKNVNIGGDLQATGKLTVGGISQLNGQVTVHAALGGAQENYDNYPLRVEGASHGVAIKVNATLPDRNINFVTMYDGTGAAMGRIEGFQGLTGVARNIVNDIVNGVSQDSASVYGTSTDQDQAAPNPPSSVTQFFNSNYGFGLLVGTLDFVYSIVQFAINAAAAAGLCIVGDCDDAIWAGISMVVNGVKLGGYIAYNELNLGVAYESGGADYAEWLKKADSGEAFVYGDVVGVKGGLISKSFVDAEKFMVISQSPSVIGAMPAKGYEASYEKIAFMGQVQVKVIGTVHRGDYILPTGNGDGFAIAVAPDKMLARDYARIIGIAWGESDGKELFSYVNTAVGINANDMAQTVENMQIVINQMQLALQQLDPDYKPHFFDTGGNDIVRTKPSYTTSPTLQQLALNRYVPSTYSNLQEALAPMVEKAKHQNFDLTQYPYLEDLMKNPGDKELAQKTIDHYTRVLDQLERYAASSGRR
ncbi:MAG TPA: hypothetical protein PLZ12_17925 [Saprospiraceae bacterium]|nr:hypothetical protein [Saprospiraceae bacterium]HRK83327.1 hypothetical protein [Saprospiraceae bacterium]